jgi:D-xylose reductase
LTRGLPLEVGEVMPAVGLGLWKIAKSEVAPLIRQAVEVGYRHFDGASDYGNEPEAGVGLRDVMARGLVSRDDLWVTGKLWNAYHRREHVRPALERTLHDLQLDYLDLYLIHFPIALEYVPFDVRYPAGWNGPESADARMRPARVPLAETWGAMEDVVRAGLVRHIGVCNYNSGLLNDLLSYASIAPAVLQIELHPYLAQTRLLRHCVANQIAVVAFSPLGASSYVSLNAATHSDSVLGEPAVRDVAARLRRSPAQVVLRWALQRGTGVIPKTSRAERLRENFALFDFELSAADMAAISALDRARRFNDPGVFCESAFGQLYPIFD